MKRTTALLLLLLTAALLRGSAHAQGTAFAYQGRLSDGASLANGNYDLRFAIFDAASAGAQEGNTLTNAATVVTNGLFTVTLDFGNQFPGADRWLGIGVRTNGGGAFTSLDPRQLLTPTPYAIYSSSANESATANAVINGAVSAPHLNTPGLPGSGQILGFSGGNLVWTNPAATAFAWNLTGNAGTTAGANFLGTTDDQPLEIKVNNVRALRLEPDPRLGGDAANLVGGHPANQIELPYSGGSVIVGGGYLGAGNIIRSNSSGVFIGAGSGNQIGPNVNDAVIGGGYGNLISCNAMRAVIGGGDNNRVEMDAAGAGIGGGTGNTIREGASGGRIDGGFGNVIGTNAFNAKIGGGTINGIDYGSREAEIGGGFGNVIGKNADFSTIGGGYGNWIQNFSQFATVGGGRQNVIGTNAAQSFIGGGQGNAIEPGSPNSFIGGGLSNVIKFGAFESTVAGGRINCIQTNAHDSTISGGVGNVIGRAADGSTIGGGNSNTIASGSFATIAGGDQNVVGDATSYGGAFATVGGGSENVARGSCSAIPGGLRNSALGFCSFAGGHRAKASDNGSFVWADTVDADFGYPGDNKFQVRATGGVLFYANGPATIGVYLAPGGNSWAPTSDRNAKENFRAIDPQDVLAKVAMLPVLDYNLKSQTNTIRHLGPMAQDFAAAFHLGEDDKHITTIDADGVALAAIQGLNQKLTEELKRRDAENAELKQRLEALERFVKRQIAVNEK